MVFQRVGFPGILVAVAAIALSCANLREPGAVPAGRPPRAEASALGYSGMAPLGPNRYLVVHDTKQREDRGDWNEPRIGVLEVSRDGGYRHAKIEIADWKDPEGRSSDLESACALSGRVGEFLVAESGYWNGKYGRIFRLRISGERAEVLAVYKLPRLGDANFEGLACLAREDGRYLLLLGERGESKDVAKGRLYRGVLDPEGDSIAWSDDDGASLEVVPPGSWPPKVDKRAIADLYVDGGGMLWAVATAEPDPDDNGPFRSLIYRLGEVSPNADPPVTLASSFSPAWILDGMKVEALGPPARAVEGSVLGIATEDEDLGGVWRALFPSVGPAHGP